MRIHLTYLIIFVCSMSTYAQDKGDYNWLFGYDSGYVDFFGGSNINFDENQPIFFKEDRTMNIDVTNASISNKAGQLLMYTNGVFIANASHEVMENGDGLNPGGILGYDITGLPIPQAALILPLPRDSNRYYILHEGLITIPLQGSQGITISGGPLRTSLVDMSFNNGLGKVIEKNTIAINDTLDYGRLTATKHANGQDWWILLPQYNSNLIYRLLLTSEGVLNKEPLIVPDTIYTGFGQSTFSTDGSKFIHISLKEFGENYLTIFDFDRCSGTLSNQQIYFYTEVDASAGVAVSPNARYLYLSSHKEIYQFDLTADDIFASKDTVAISDGYKEPILLENGDTIELVTRFFLAQLAPDGRIYLNTSNGVRSLHVINYPDRGGVACEVAQHSVKLPTYNRFSLPNFPNYRLGPIDGSPCDTLGVNNFPQAKYRYDLDTLEALSFYFNDLSYYEPTAWHWDFGDGEMSEEVNPSHTFLDYGTYEVCLTVSNEYGSHTFCQTLDLSLTAFTERVVNSTLSVFPNPANDLLYLKMEETADFSGTWYLFNALGQVVKAYSMDASLVEVDLRDLGAGIYFYSFVEGGGVVDLGKLVVE